MLVDLDDVVHGRHWDAIIVARSRLRAAGYRVVSMQALGSRRHTHLVIRVKPAPRRLMEKITLQLLCGSDPDREANNIRRAKVLRRMPGWARQTANVLYEKPSTRRNRGRQ